MLQNFFKLYEKLLVNKPPLCCNIKPFSFSQFIDDPPLSSSLRDHTPDQHTLQLPHDAGLKLVEPHTQGKTQTLKRAQQTRGVVAARCSVVVVRSCGGCFKIVGTEKRWNPNKPGQPKRLVNMQGL